MKTGNMAEEKREKREQEEEEKKNEWDLSKNQNELNLFRR